MFQPIRGKMTYFWIIQQRAPLSLVSVSVVFLLFAVFIFVALTEEHYSSDICTPHNCLLSPVNEELKVILLPHTRRPTCSAVAVLKPFKSIKRNIHGALNASSRMSGLNLHWIRDEMWNPIKQGIYSPCEFIESSDAERQHSPAMVTFSLWPSGES